MSTRHSSCTIQAHRLKRKLLCRSATKRPLIAVMMLKKSPSHVPQQANENGGKILKLAKAISKNVELCCGLYDPSQLGMHLSGQQAQSI